MNAPRPATNGSSASAPDLSLVAPVYNESENLRLLHGNVCQALDSRLDWELVLVDDGSTDDSAAILRALAADDDRVRPVFLPRNRGQTGALLAGIQETRAPLVATLDADLQNDPADLPAMVGALGDADAVVGYRAERKDHVVRRVSSRFANGVRNRLTGDHVRDTGCSLKLFRREALRAIPPFEGMHRFIPTLLRWHGCTVIEFPVSHHPRIHGESKYGVRNRAFRAFRDLLAVRWMKSRIVQLPEPVDRSGHDE